MDRDLHFETTADTAGPTKEWGMHNGVVVLVALALVALSVFLGWLPQTDLLAAGPLWAVGFLSSVGFVLMLAAGSVIGMLVATRMLQAHVGARAARILTLWGLAALVGALLLQAGLYALSILWMSTDPGIPGNLVIQVASSVVTGTMAVGAAMIALAFAGRLHR